MISLAPGPCIESDGDLIRRFKKGDESAFVEIVDRYKPRIFASALRLIHNYSDAEDITQITFIRVHRSLRKFQGDSKFSTWLYQIVRNLSINHYWYLKRRGVQNSCSFEAPAGEGFTLTLEEVLGSGEPTPQISLSAQDSLRTVEELLEDISPIHKEILIMSGFRNLSYKEMAEACRVSIGTVKSRISRAREELRELLIQRYPEFQNDKHLSRILFAE